MYLKIFLLSTLCLLTFGEKYHCSQKSALLFLKQPAYVFSVKILDSVTQEMDGHFVFSPLATWLQLDAFAEGARGSTLWELRKITKHHRNKCFRKKLSDIVRSINRDLGRESKKKSVMIIDQLMAVKKSFKRDVEKMYGIKVMSLDFNNPKHSAMKVNRLISSATNGVLPEAIYEEDFNDTVFILSDTMYFKTQWKKPFEPSYTKIESFYDEKGIIKLGEVNMMNKIDYFNVTDFPLINATVLELPCENERFSMLIFKPKNHSWSGDIFFALKKIRLTSIFNMFKRQRTKLVNVRLPRFRITTGIDNIPELLYDMGVTRIFQPDLAELQGISDFKIHASLMTQISDIEVTEKGVTASADVGFLVNDIAAMDFVANKPFAFMLLDRRTEFIIFAGMYTQPEIY